MNVDVILTSTISHFFPLIFIDCIMSITIKQKGNQKSRTDHVSSYQYTKTGLIGEQRGSMLESELQLLSELGKSHRRGHKLPPSEFTYGLRNASHDGGVAEAMYNTCIEQQTTNHDVMYVRDYLALNKAALEAGMFTARNQSRFRSIHDIQKKICLRDTSRVKTKLIFSDDTIFGLPYKPSTPMSQVLQNHFANQWFQTIQNQQISLKKQNIKSPSIQSRYHTKTSLLRQAKIPIPPQTFPRKRQSIDIDQYIDSLIQM
ncbi:hypothetical protein I4U23_028149 [Adineta vaga]|nr:hypothetical protein I4U23_028149 [Adineta vaga]